jgi:hypothetical protein
MALVPEHILQAVIVRGIEAMRRDSRLVEQLFRNVDRAGQEQMRELFKSRVPFDLCLNYPREVLKLPGIVILLRSQDEGQAFIGDSMGVATPDEFSYDGGLETDIIGGVASASSMSAAEPPLLFGPCRVESGTATTILISGVSMNDRWEGRNATARIVAGTGAGQSRKVASNTAQIVTVTPAWKITPDDTSIFEVRGDPVPVVPGAPARLYDRRDTTLWTEQLGVYDAMQYQIQVASPNPAMTIYLCTILRAIMFLSRRLLEQQGIINMKIAASDLAPKAEYLPDPAYVRVLNLSFMAPFTVIKELGDLATSLQLEIETSTADGWQDTMVTSTSVGLTVDTIEG